MAKCVLWTRSQMVSRYKCQILIERLRDDVIVRSKSCQMAVQNRPQDQPQVERDPDASVCPECLFLREMAEPKSEQNDLEIKDLTEKSSNFDEKLCHRISKKARKWKIKISTSPIPPNGKSHFSRQN